MFNRLRLRTKLAFLLVLAAVAVILSIGFSASLLHDRLTADRVDKLRAIVQSQIAIARGLETQVTAKKITREQAIDQLRQSIHLLRFDAGDGYVVVSAADGRGIINGASPAREGQIAPPLDNAGHTVSALEAEALRGGDEGVIRYSYPKPGQTVAQSKIAYVARFAPWDGVFLSGAYVDDIDAIYAAA